MRRGACALLALVLALLPGMARSEAVFTREIDHVVSMETMEGGLLLSGSYADGEADRPSVKFLDFAGRRLYSRGDRAHDGGYADAALFDGGGCAVLRYGDEGYCVDFLRDRETVWNREVSERGALNLFCDGERILVDAAPAVGVLDADGAGHGRRDPVGDTLGGEPTLCGHTRLRGGLSGLRLPRRSGGKLSFRRLRGRAGRGSVAL